MPLVEALGRALRALRQEARLTQATAAWRAQIGERSLRRIEAGQRRTRASTLYRLVVGFDLPDTEHRLAELLQLVGPALAAESQYAERIDARRQRRHRKAARRYVTEHSVVHLDHEQGLLAVHTHRRRVSRTATVQRTYEVLHTPDGRRLHRRHPSGAASTATRVRRQAGARMTGGRGTGRAGR